MLLQNISHSQLLRSAMLFHCVWFSREDDKKIVMVWMSESCSENWGKYTDMIFPTRCYVDEHKDEVLYIKIKHIIADSYVIFCNHTAS
jgi:hypothetical protein